MSQLQADETEPQEVLRLLDQKYDLDVGPWNKAGWADYHYTGVPCFCHGSSEYNCERKTWGDLSNGIEDIEMQLANQMDKHPGIHHRLLIEGIAEPAAKGLLLYTKAQGQNVFRAGLRGEKVQQYKSIMAWLHQVGKYWEVVWTPSMAATAITVAAFYDGDQVQEESHGTFHRIFKQYDYRADPQAVRIMGAAADVPLGPVRAEAVAKHFGTAYRAYTGSVSEWVKVPGIGEVLARKYLRGLGRGDV